MRVTRLLLLSLLCALYAPSAFAASITLTGSASGGAFGDCGFTTKTFSDTYTGQDITETLGASRPCRLLVSDPPPNFGVFSGDASLDAALNGVNGNVVLHWSGNINQRPLGTEGDVRVALDIVDVLHIVGGGDYRVDVHVDGTGTTSVATCNGFKFNGSVFIRGVLQQNPATITPCTNITDRSYTFSAVDGESVALRTLLSGEIGFWGPLSTASFDGSHTGVTTITALTPGGSFFTDSGLTFGTTAVPEPGTLSLLAAGIGAVGAWRERRRRANTAA